MDEHRLGFLAPSSLIAGFLTLLLTAGIWLTRGGALFSPGSLDRERGKPIEGVTSHADLSGKCSACHGTLVEQGSMDERCMACHTDIAAQRDDPATLHGNMEKNIGSLDCLKCHQEHGGLLKDQNKAKVVHDWFGYSLEAHTTRPSGAGFQCTDCHTKDINSFDSQECNRCHLQVGAETLQEHIQAFGEDCLACHDGADRFGSGFDHDQFTFRLEGKHAGADCSQCHQVARTPEGFKTAPTECNACHAQDNPHSEALGTDCAECHTAESWQTETFDHNLSAFKLSGAHTEVACTDCHVNNVYRGTPTDCYSCHEGDDKHQGQYGMDCALCHTDSGWTTVEPFDHNAFSFKLTGRHVNVPCTSCHVNGNFKDTPKDCENCHRNISPHNDGLYIHCAYCHSTHYW